MEVLQDHLLHLLDPVNSQGELLHPRDIVVMVPDIEVVAPAIRAVFGPYRRYDKRYIPFDIADLSAKSNSPIIASMEWLLRLAVSIGGDNDTIGSIAGAVAEARFGIPDEIAAKTWAYLPLDKLVVVTALYRAGSLDVLVPCQIDG